MRASVSGARVWCLCALVCACVCVCVCVRARKHALDLPPVVGIMFLDLKALCYLITFTYY